MLNTASLKMIAERLLSDPIPPGMSTDELNTSNAAITKLLGVVEATGIEEQAIEKDRNSSDDGKRVKKAVLGNRIIVNMEFLGRMREQAGSAHTRLSAVVFDPMTTKPAGDAVVFFLREQSIRDSLDLDSGSLAGAFLQAIDTDNLEVVRSILDWPGQPKALADDVLERGRIAYATRTNPSGLHKLQSLELLRERLDMLADATSQWLIGMGADERKVNAALKL